MVKDLLITHVGCGGSIGVVCDNKEKIVNFFCNKCNDMIRREEVLEKIPSKKLKELLP